MQLGELFFNLGFRSTGTAEARGFENSINSAQIVSDNLSDALGRMQLVLEQIAVHIGATTQVNIDLIRSNEDVGRSITDTTTAQNRQNSAMSRSTISMRSVIDGTRNLVTGFSIATTAIFAATSAFVAFIKTASNAAVNVDKISSMTGMSTDAIQRLGDMAAQTGGSIDDIGGAIGMLQKASIDISMGKGGNLGVYQFLGLDPHEDPLTMLEQLSKKLKTMPAALGTAMAKDLGLSDELIYMLRNMDDISPMKKGMSEKEIKRLKQFNFMFNKIWEESKRVMQRAASVMMPIGKMILEVFSNLAEMFTNALDKMNPFFKSIKQYIPWLVGLGAVLFAVFFPVTAAILGLALALDDIRGFMQGEDSVFGGMVKYLTDINGLVRDAIVAFWDLAQAMTIGGDTKYKDYFDKKREGAEEWIKDRSKKQKEGTLFKPEESILKDTTMPQGFEDSITPKQGIEKAFEYLKKTILPSMPVPGLDPKGIIPTTPKGIIPTTPKGIIPTTPKVEPQGVSPKSDVTSQNNTNNNVINIAVNESKTPKETASAIKNEIANAFFQLGRGEIG